ncbi:MAG: regulatory protein RecX [Pseudomonadota bacterium]
MLLEPLDDEAPRDPRGARRYAMDALARREYGFAELVRRLEKRGFDADTAHATVAELNAEGLQDDARFAEAMVASAARRGKGPRRIEAELTERDLPGAIIAAALGEAGIDWYALAADVREGKFGAVKPADFTEKARQMRFLNYRGFDNEQIRHAVDA